MPEGRDAAALGRSLLAAVETIATGTRHAGALDRGARRALLADVDRATAVLTTVRGALLLAERESGDWRGSGAPSFAAWRGSHSREGVRAGAVEERRADALGVMPGLRDAAVTGDVTVQHVDAVGRVATTGSEAVRSAIASAEGQEKVLTMARRLDAGRFATAMAQFAARADAAALERGHQAQRASRYLHLTHASDGTRISGRLDRMAGHRLALALEALSPRPAADDDRSAEQRRADALETMAEKVLSLPDTVPGAAQRPHVAFVMTETSWAQLRAARTGAEASARTEAEARRPASDMIDLDLDLDRVGGRGGALDDLAEALATVGPMDPVTLEDGTPVPASEVARALCDCELTRVVLDARSEPVDLGRSARTYTGAQRRAVLTRDGACFWDGCHLAPRWLEVHHLRWWDRDDGETSVENGVAACSFHHHEVHRRDLMIRRVPLDADEVNTTSRRVRYVVTSRDGCVVAGRPPGSEPPSARSRPTVRTGRQLPVAV